MPFTCLMCSPTVSEEKLRLDEEREGLKTVKSDLHEKTVRVKELEVRFALNAK